MIPEEDFVSTELEKCALEGSIDGVDGPFSLCCSLEVAEHLPPECADGFVSLLTGLSKVILFSAAIPHQGGTHHVNEQWATFWIEKFFGKGYLVTDYVRMEIWGNKKIQPWYRQNILLFLEENLFPEYESKITDLKYNPDVELLSKVHPDFYEMVIEYSNSRAFYRKIKSKDLFLAVFDKINHYLRGKS